MSSVNGDASPRGWANYDFLKLGERIPVVSTVISVAALVFQAKNDIEEGPSDYSFSQYVYETPGIRSATLLIPLLGNIIVILHDLINAKYDDEEHMLEEIKNDVHKARDVSPRLLNDISFLYKACSVQPKLLDYGHSNKLRANREWMLKFITEHPGHTTSASHSLLNDKAYVEKALEVGTDPYISNHIGIKLLDDRDIVKKAIECAAPDIIDKLQGDLRDDLEFQRELVRINPEAYREAQAQRWSLSMKGDKILLKMNPKGFDKDYAEEIKMARIDPLPILEDAQIVREIFMDQKIDEKIREEVLFTYLENNRELLFDTENNPFETPESSALCEIIELAVEHCNNLKGLYGYIKSLPFVLDNVHLAIKAVKRDPKCFEYSYSTRHYKRVQQALKDYHPDYYAENNIAAKYPVRDTKYGEATAVSRVDEGQMEELMQQARN